jgi:hypothetical protein
MRYISASASGARGGILVFENKHSAISSQQSAKISRKIAFDKDVTALFE